MIFLALTFVTGCFSFSFSFSTGFTGTIIFSFGFSATTMSSFGFSIIGIDSLLSSKLGTREPKSPTSLGIDSPLSFKLEIEDITSDFSEETLSFGFFSITIS